MVMGEGLLAALVKALVTSVRCQVLVVYKKNCLRQESPNIVIHLNMFN